MAYTIAFFGTKPYDEASFNDKNKEFGFEFRYYKGHLNKNNYNRQIKKFPTEKQNVSLKHILT